MLPYRIHMMGMMLRSLHHDIKFRQYHTGYTKLISSSQHLRMWRHQQLHQLCLNSLCADILQIPSQCSCSICRLLFNLEPKLSRKPYRPKYAQGIFFEPFSGHTYAANHTMFQIFYPTKCIYHSATIIISHGIDCKISSSQIFF